MKKFFLTLLILLLILAGAAYLLFPTVMTQIAAVHDTETMRTYRNKVQDMSREQISDMLESAAAYNASLTATEIGDVFTETGRRTSRDYLHHLDVSDGVIGIMRIPRIGIAMPFYHSSTEHSALNQLVHVDGSSLPADSAGSQIVLAGPGQKDAEGFLKDIGLKAERALEDLDKILPDDLIILQVLDRTMVYRVEDVKTLSPDGLKHLETEKDEEQDSLILMTPRKDRRVVVQASRIPIAEARTSLNETDQAEIPSLPVSILALGSPVMLLGCIVMAIIGRIKKRKYRLPTEIKKSRKDDDEETDLPEEDKETPTDGKEATDKKPE